MGYTVNPVISVIIPIYKVEQYVSDCIKSVLNQTYQNLEIILVDDGSPDRSTDIAEEVLKNSEKKYIIIRQQNKGLGEARNSGFKAATGEWVYFLDSDDIIVPETIERLVSAINLDTDFVFSDYNVIRDKNEVCNGFEKVKPVYYDRATIQKEFLLRKKTILAPGTLYKKCFLDKNQLKFAGIRWSEDQQFLFRVLKHVNTVGYLKEPLYQYLQREGSIMNATEPQSIIEGYSAIVKVGESYECGSLLNKFIAARWVMGSLNSTARTYDYDKWKSLYSDLDGKKRLKVLLSFPDIKVKILAFIGVLFPKLYYKLTENERTNR